MILLQGLHFYQALGLALFGGMLSTLMGLPEGWAYSPHWFCGALMIYNADRSLPDPADAINQPHRYLRQVRLRGVSFALSLAAGVLLLTLPIRSGDWRLFGILLAGGVICLSYSLPIFGIRLKRVPVMSSLFPPFAIVIALIGLPALDVQMVPAQRVLAGMVFGWAFLLLAVNVVMCDLRDLPGDQASGIMSLAVYLGEFETRKLVRASNTAASGIALLIGFVLQDARPAIAMLIANAYLALVLRFYPPPPQHRGLYYEWLLDGFLYIAPAGTLLVYYLAG